MNILLCGATGFIGRHIHAALRAAGHQVHAPSRRGAPALDFSRALHVRDWLPHLAGQDAVINAVGVLRNTRRQPMAAVHDAAPRALFDACAQAGVRRVVHVSALGIDGNPTLYARSKQAADAHLLALTQAGQLDGVVLRPSIVFGRGGDSSELFMRLARCPALLLPRPVQRAQVQPLAVGELAEAVARLVSRRAPTGLIELGGAQALTLAAFIASLRQQLGHRRAWVAPLPGVLTTLSVRLGDRVPVVPWCSETLALLAQDNVTDSTALQALLGRAPTPPDELLHVTPALNQHEIVL
ncbi:NAD-dependent epimerase/dehydratase family protein [Ottowia testudinis]|uniref:NAD-dependent epimerase/dehydratase family protein n=1 Tax=Ottowia testudinis TaxID=2816950 RepID=A0A975CHW4_9BURK|nr:NAD-dependent epimerase/dehydratase family protein [Ottowia testudinis]QTD46733.1 NAD-dependent epimerase/dehydratase family protein [Ottowia testudinis]